MSGGSPQTTVSQSGPPQVFLDAYGRVVNRAENVAQTPYERYPGTVVAPFSPDQLSAMNIVRASQGINAPYINQAADYIDQSTGNLLAGVPQMSGQMLSGVADRGLSYINQAGDNGILDAVGRLSPDSILPWMSPYTDEVVTATQNDFARSNEQQRQGVVGNAISRGAWGGDRSAVAEGILAGEQQRVQAPVLAGLRDRGFQTGLGAAQNAAALGVQGATADAAARRAAGVDLLGLYTGQQGLGFGANQAQANLAQQAGYGMAGLGREAQSSALAGAQALAGVGGMQQEQAQRQLNVPYEMFLAEQQYPFQTTGWLSNITSGLGGAAGSTNRTTAPGPSALSQLGGLGMSAAGIIGGTGGFGANGWLSGLFGGGGGGGLVVPGGFADGGAVPDYAAGGGVSGNAPFAFGGGMDAPDLTISVVPGADGIDVAAMPGAKGKTPNILTSTGTTTTTEGGGGGFLSSLLGLAGNVVGGIYGGPAGSMAGGMAGRSLGAAFGLADGGGVPEVITRPGIRPGSAIPRLSWGMPGMATGLGAAVVPAFDASSADPVNSYLSEVMRGASYAAPKAYVPPPPPVAQAPPQEDEAIEENPFWWRVADEGGGGGDGFAQGGLIGYAVGGDLPLVEEEDEDAEGIVTGADKPGFMAPGNPWNALIYAGLGTMAGTSSSPLANLGKGALEGLRVYGQDRRSAESTEARRENARLMAKYREQMAETQRRRADAYERKVDADAALAGAREERLLRAVSGGGGGGGGGASGSFDAIPVRKDGQTGFMIFNRKTGNMDFVPGAEAAALVSAAGIDERARARNEGNAATQARLGGQSRMNAITQLAREKMRQPGYRGTMADAMREATTEIDGVMARPTPSAPVARSAPAPEQRGAAIASAKAAIARGAPRDAVIKRLTEAGFAPEPGEL